jgi:hypothetical protein
MRKSVIFQMSLLNQSPYFILSVLKDWIYLKELVFVDTSFCNKAGRQTFLELMCISKTKEVFVYSKVYHIKFTSFYLDSFTSQVVIFDTDKFCSGRNNRLFEKEFSTLEHYRDQGLLHNHCALIKRRATFNDLKNRLKAIPNKGYVVCQINSETTFEIHCDYRIVTKDTNRGLPFGNIFCGEIKNNEFNGIGMTCNFETYDDCKIYEGLILVYF